MAPYIDPTLINATGGVTPVNSNSPNTEFGAGQVVNSEEGTDENSQVAANFDEIIEGATEEEMSLLSNIKDSITTYDTRIQEHITAIRNKENEKEELKKQLEMLNAQMAFESDPDARKSIQGKISSKNSEITSKISEIISESNAMVNTFKQRDTAAKRYSSTAEKTRTNAQKRTEQEEALQQLQSEQASGVGSTGNNYNSGNNSGVNATKLETKADFAAYGFTTDDQINRFKQLTPEMQTATIGLIDYAHANGLKVSVTSSYRSNAEQQALYNDDLASHGGAPSGFVAKPGSSNHEMGIAVDIKIEGADMHNKNDPKCKLLGEYWIGQGYRWGGVWTSANEPWHFDLKSSYA